MFILNKYSTWLRVFPYRTKMLSSMVIFGLSDVICQKVVERQPVLSKKRVAQIGSVGLFAGVGLHLYFEKGLPMLTNRILPGLFPKFFSKASANQLILTQLVFDQTIGAV